MEENIITNIDKKDNENITPKNNISYIKNINNINNKIIKYFKGIVIYFKEYIIFIKGNSIKLMNLINYGIYHWGFQMMIIYGCFQSYVQINNILNELD